MLNVYCSTKVKRPVKASDKLSGYLRSSRFKDCVRKSWLHVVLSLLFVVSASGALVPQTVRADHNGYLLDKVIEWADGTTEHIQIGDDGYFILDGVKKRLVGMNLNVHHMPYGDIGEFWLPENLAIYDKELAYLESVGVRLIQTCLEYALWWPSPLAEEERFSALLDLLYKHKMLVVPQITGKGMPGFGNLAEPDFRTGLEDGEGGRIDSFGAWARRWADIVKQYPNVVAVVAENELDGPFRAEDMWWDPANAQDQHYTAAEVANHMDFLTSIFRSRINAPIVHKLIGHLNMPQYTTDIKRVCLDMTDNPSFNCHQPSAEQLDKTLDSLMSWLNQEGYRTTGWWVFEMNKAYPPEYPPDAAGFTVDFIDTAFNHGASVACLFVSNWSTQPGWQFFNDNGDPVPKLVEIAQELERLQAPVSTMLAQK